MKTINRIVLLLLMGLLMSLSTGCATYTTISAADRGSAKVYSGTRLDLRAVTGQATETKKFPVAPPRYPLVDLPFSFALDTVILPLTTSVVLYQAVFE